MNQLCFSSTTNMNYDNLDILVVEPKKQENQYFRVPAKVCGTRNMEVTLHLFLDFPASTKINDTVSHPLLTNHSSWEARTRPLGR